jgi:hypothetical protein
MIQAAKVSVVLGFLALGRPVISPQHSRQSTRLCPNKVVSYLVQGRGTGIVPKAMMIACY